MLILKIVITFTTLLFFSFIIVKTYEVPIYVTKFTLEHNTFFGDSANLEIDLIRNYDRSKNLHKDDGAYTITRNLPGGIFVNGVLLRQSVISDLSDSLNRKKDTIYNVLTSFIKEHCDPDSFPLESIGEVVLLKIEGTYRQHLYMGSLGSVPPDTFYIAERSILSYVDGRNYLLNKGYGYCDVLSSGNNSYCFYNYFSSTKEDTVCYVNCRNTAMGFKPVTKNNFLFIAEDISKGIEILKFSNLKSRHINRIHIDYLGAAQYGVINPKPDSITISGIYYTDPNKIEQITQKGLIYHVSFPDMENMQEFKLTLLAMAITLLIGVLFNLFYRLFYKGLRNLWINHPRFCIILVIAFVLSVAYVIWYYMDSSTVNPHLLLDG